MGYKQHCEAIITIFGALGILAISTVFHVIFGFSK